MNMMNPMHMDGMYSNMCYPRQQCEMDWAATAGAHIGPFMVRSIMIMKFDSLRRHLRLLVQTRRIIFSYVFAVFWLASMGVSRGRTGECDI